MQDAKRKKLFALADELELSREDRIDLARTLLRRDINSWADLTDAQVERMLDAFDGFVLITHLRQMM